LQAGALVPIAVFVVVLVGVSIRMLALWRRTRALPEMCLGFALTVAGGAGMPLAALGRVPAWIDTSFGKMCFALSMLAFPVGIGLLYLFTLKLYRWHSRIAWILTSIAWAGVLVSGVGVGVGNAQGRNLGEILPLIRPYGFGLVASMLVCSTWASIEAFTHYAKLRKRLALGLADPVLMNRFLLWGIANATAVLLCSGLLPCVQAGIVVLQHALPLTMISMAGLVMSVAWYLTFFAPEPYQRYLRRRAEAPYAG